MIKMKNKSDLITIINKNKSKFSKSQTKIAAYITNHYEKGAFMTASALGKTVGVSESTVVRFASELGYDGYPEFQAELQDLIKNKLTSVQRMEITSSKMSDGEILRSVLQSDIDKLKRTRDTIDETQFLAAVDAVANADNIYILGARFSIASFLGFYLNFMSGNAVTITTNSASETFEQIYRANEKDVVIAVSYPRYSQRTLNAVKYAYSKGSTVIAITDSPNAPITDYAKHTLIATSDMSSFVDSLVAPLSLINALIVALVVRNKEQVSKVFEEMEDIWDEYGVYKKHITDESEFGGENE